MHLSLGVRRAARLLPAVATAILFAGVLPAGAGTAQKGGIGSGITFQGESGAIPDFEAREGRVAPTSEQLSMVDAIGATARWNSFGTPHSLMNHGGYLATGLSADPVTAARSWVSDNRALFRLSQTGLDNLEVINSRPIGNEGAAVLF